MSATKSIVIPLAAYRSGGILKHHSYNGLGLEATRQNNDPWCQLWQYIVGDFYSLIGF